MHKNTLSIVAIIVSVIAIGLSLATLRGKETTAVLADGSHIESDSTSHIIRFYIDGQEQAVLDAKGLHVRGDIDYTGTITDGNRYSDIVTEKRRVP